MKLSAIVPTHDRPDALRQCLATLRQQDASDAELEVVVVDDGSRSDVAAVVSECSVQSPVRMRCEQGEMTGLNGARNRGAAVADGDVLAFLDDDTLVSPGWARALLTAFTDHPCAAVGGRVRLRLEAPAPDWLEGMRHYLAEYDLGPEPLWLDDDVPGPVGANCAIRQSDFEQLGGFQPGLDRIADSLVSNGDTELFRRLRKSGGRMRYEPAASVIHCVPPERLTVGFFIERHRAQGLSDELLLRLEGHVPSLGHRIGLMGAALRTGKFLVSDVLSGRGTVRTRLLVSYWLGRLAALRRGTADISSRLPGST